MQKQKIIIAQATYEHIELALADRNFIIDQSIVDKKQASSNLIITLDELLSRNDTALDEIAALVVNQGPAPFTTLRVLLATVNGISYATKIPLIGLDGIGSLLQEHYTTQWPITVALFNAYNNECYFGISSNQSISTDCSSIEILVRRLEQYKEPIRIMGAGIQTFKTLLQEIPYVHMNTTFYPSLGFLATQGYVKADNHKFCEQLLPLYLKQTSYKPSV